MEEDGEIAGAKQYQTEKDSEPEHPREKEIQACYWLDREDKDIHEIREEEIPLKDRSRAHDDKGGHDVEAMVSDLSPERTRHRVRRKGMRGRGGEERHHQAGSCDGSTKLHH